MKQAFRLKDVHAGFRYGMLTAVSFTRKDASSRHTWWIWRCDCGNYKEIACHGVAQGNNKSCGCAIKANGDKKRSPNNGSEITAIILQYKRHAFDRHLSWELSREQVVSLIEKPCYYCGIPPSNYKTTKNSLKGGGKHYSGIDRVDSTKGYFMDNCVPCCKICNFAKSNLDINEFQNWALRLGAMAEQWSEALS